MGWSVLSKAPAAGWVAYLDDVLAGGSGNKALGAAIVASAIGDDGNYYAAVKPGRDVGAIGVVVVIEGGAYKILDEACGPFYYGAPAAVLDALEDTGHPFALKWRARCRERLAAGVAA